MKVACLSLAAIVVAGVGCSSLQTVSNPHEFFSQANPDVVVVIYNDQSEMPVAKPQMRGDTIVGTWHGLGESVEVPLSDVKRIDAMQKDSRKTTAFIGAMVGVAAMTTYGLMRAVENHGYVCDYNRPEDRQCYGSAPDPDGP